MILSHSKKFIFFKTLKTSSTSLEIILSKYLNELDVITPIINLMSTLEFLRVLKQNKL